MLRLLLLRELRLQVQAHSYLGIVRNRKGTILQRFLFALICLQSIGLFYLVHGLAFYATRGSLVHEELAQCLVLSAFHKSRKILAMVCHELSGSNPVIWSPTIE